MTEKSESPAAPACGAPGAVTTFYDGSCPVCSFEINHYKKAQARHGGPLAWRDLSDDPEALAALGVSPAAARRRMHAIDEDGRLVSGVDAFLAIWRNLPRYRLLAVLVAAPGIRQLAGGLYEWVMVPWLAWLNRRRDRRKAALLGG